MSDSKDNDLLDGLNLIEDDELAEEVPGDDVDAMTDIVDLLDDDEALVPETKGLEVTAGDSETVESPPAAEVRPEATIEPPLDKKPKKKRNKPKAKVDDSDAAISVTSKETIDLYENLTASVGAVVLNAGVLHIRASKVVIEAENIVFK